MKKGQTFIVTGSEDDQTAHVRAEAKRNSRELAVLPKDTRVTVVESPQGDSKWAKIRYKDRKGEDQEGYSHSSNFRPATEQELKAAGASTGRSGSVATTDGQAAHAPSMAVAAQNPEAKPDAKPAESPGKCNVYTASYGGQKASIIQAQSGNTTNYTVLDVNEGAEKREVDAYIAAYAKGGQVIGEFNNQQKALDKAFELCPEGTGPATDVKKLHAELSGGSGAAVTSAVSSAQAGGAAKKAGPAQRVTPT